MSTDLRTRIDQGDLHFLDGLVLLGTIASQRWFGGKSRDVLDARVLDAGVVPGESPLLAFAIVEVRYGLQSHDLYHLPLGFRPESDNWKASIIAATEGWTVYDAIADPELVRGIIDLVAADETLDIGEATLLFRSTGDLRDSLGEHSDVRPMGAEQSNTSAVIDERLALKVYRRIEAGMNPELEILRFLTERGFEHIAAARGLHLLRGEAARSDPRDPAAIHSVQRRRLGARTRHARFGSGLASGAHPPARVRSRRSSTTLSPPIRSTSTSRPRSPAPRRSRSSRLRSTRRSSRCSQPCRTSRRSRPCAAAAKRSATGSARSRTSGASAG